MQENHIYNDAIDLKELFQVLWRGKYFIIFFTLISLIMGSLYLRNASIEYEVSVLLAPVQEEQVPKLNGLGDLASLAGITLPSGTASDFSKFEIMLKSKKISSLIFKDKNLIQGLFSHEWDDKQQIFREPKQKRSQVLRKHFKEVLTGQQPKDYIDPNPARLKAFIDRNIRVSLNNKTQYLTISGESSNPKLLKQLFLSMINNTDDLFKKKFIKQANDAVKFYQIKISKARSQEHREILATLIAKEERKLLLATRDAPFVAEILIGPNRSINPISPRPTLTLVLSILIGALLTSGLILIRNFLSKNNNEYK